MDECWKTINGYENFYEVSDHGRVKSLRFNRILINHFNPKNGYESIILCGTNGKKAEYIHRLVAKAFIPNPDNLSCINHKDENKRNNNYTNLEWCTQHYNNTYNSKTQRCCKAVIATNLITQEEKIYPSARIAENNTGANHKNISAVCHGLRKSAAGYKWRFMNNE